MTTSKFTPWAVAQSPTDPEMYCVRGVYLVADCLPIEDARLIAAAPDMYEALCMVAVDNTAGSLEAIDLVMAALSKANPDA